MSDKGCCFCLPSWVATIPGWIVAVLFLIYGIVYFKFGNATSAGILATAVANFTLYVLSATMKESMWPRVILMIFYLLISSYVAFLCWIIPGLAGSEYCYHYGEDSPECMKYKRQSEILPIVWLIPNIFVWIGLGYYIKSAKDSKDHY